MILSRWPRVVSTKRVDSLRNYQCNKKNRSKRDKESTTARVYEQRDCKINKYVKSTYCHNSHNSTSAKYKNKCNNQWVMLTSNLANSALYYKNKPATNTFSV